MSTIMNPARPTYSKKAIGQLTGYSNGMLDDRVLVRTTARGLKMCAVSARKFNALQGLAIQRGIPLTSTGDYRTFAQQLSLQEQRYDVGYFPGRLDYNTYQGIVYSLKPGMAPAATPGTSNHGWGRARDLAVMLAGDTIPDSLRTADKLFLAEWAPKCGIFFPSSLEDWHGEDYAGDDFSLAPAVLEYERGEAGPVIPPFVPAQGMFSLYPFDARKATIRLTDPAMHSDLVAYFQGTLKVRLGYGIKVDGWFGNQTDAFARWFQGSHGLVIDGLVGPKTWAAIDKLNGVVR